MKTVLSHNDTQANVYVVHSLDKVSDCLFHRIHHAFIRAVHSYPADSSYSSSSSSPILDNGTFIIAISGGSVPSFLVDLPSYFAAANIDPQWQKWHILLADERLVPYEDNDSNLRLIQEKLLDQLPMIPKDQIHGINYELLSNYLSGKCKSHHHYENRDDNSLSIHDIAKDYQTRCLEPLWQQRKHHHRLNNNSDELHSLILFDCLILGFGPDGHTCSLFPHHSLLHEEETQWVAALSDSPKLPLERITFTLPVLNFRSRHVIFVGVGTSKQQIVKEIFSSINIENAREIETPTNDHDWSTYVGTLVDVEQTSYPCAMIRPQGKDRYLTWILDDDAAALITDDN